METQFTWKTKLFSNRFEISRYENPVGEVRGSGWRRGASGELNGKKFLFDVKGFFRKEFFITDPGNDSVLGQIFFNAWRTKATIKLGNKEYQWHYDNFFNTKWSISNENGVLIKYQSYTMSGDINTYTDDEALIVAGLFIRNYLKQRAAEAAAASV